jgi:hypothetical protein
MYLVTYFGKSNLFITFIANPNWEKIITALFKGQTIINKPNIIARMFRAKSKDLIGQIRNNEIFEKVLALIYIIKYQKRGLSHAHIIIFFTGGYAFSEPEIINNLIRVELFNRSLDPNGLLTKIVKQIMVYNLYKPLKPDVIYMKKAYTNAPLTCSKRFPKLFANKTIINKNGYPEYRRRRIVDNVNIR